MMVLVALRKILPEGLRTKAGTWLDSKIIKSKWLTLVYYYILYGVVVRLMPDDCCSITHKGTEIMMPIESRFIFFEVFIHRVYEQFPGPNRGDIVTDMGAHVGTFAVKAAKLIGDEGLVVAIEPHPMNLAFLRRNIENQNLNNVKVIEKSVWDKAEKARLYLSKRSELHSLCYVSEDYIEVEADRTDNILAELGLSHVDFIKIDVEGAEYQALRGAKKVLTYPNVRLCIEAVHVLSNGQPELPILVSYLTSKKFQTQIYRVVRPYIYATKQGNKTTVN